jgi:hypothetical protein
VVETGLARHRDLVVHDRTAGGRGPGEDVGAGLDGLRHSSISSIQV